LERLTPALLKNNQGKIRARYSCESLLSQTKWISNRI
jgi:hypothetical protein